MAFRSRVVVRAAALVLVAACTDQPTEPSAAPSFGKGNTPTPDVCDAGAAAKAASDYFLDNGQRRRVRARLQDLADSCEAENLNAARSQAWIQAFEVELALDPSNALAGDPTAGSVFLNAVLRLAGLNCADGLPCNDPIADNYHPNVDFTTAIDPGGDGAFGVRPVPIPQGAYETLAVVSRHAQGSARWAVEPQLAGEPAPGPGTTIGTWSAVLATDPSVIFGEPGASSPTAFDWSVFPADPFTEEVLMTFCGVDNGDGSLGTNEGILTRAALGLQQGTPRELDPTYCTDDGYFSGVYGPYAGPIQTAMDEAPAPGSRVLHLAGRSLAAVSDWLGERFGALVRPRPLNAAFTVNPGPRGTGLSSGFSLFDQIVVQPTTAQLEFTTQPCDVAVTEEMVCGNDGADYSVKVRAFILDQFGNEVEFERLQIRLTATNNNGVNGTLDGGNVNQCLGEPSPPTGANGSPTVPCAVTTETDGIATFRGLVIAPSDPTQQPNSAAGGYELVAEAIGPPGTFGYSVAPATSVKINISPN